MINAKYNMLQKVTRHGSVSPFAFDCIWHLTMASTNNYLLELLFSPIMTRFVWHSFRSWPGGAGHQEGAGEEPAGIHLLQQQQQQQQQLVNGIQPFQQQQQPQQQRQPSPAQQFSQQQQRFTQQQPRTQLFPLAQQQVCCFLSYLHCS